MLEKKVQEIMKPLLKYYEPGMSELMVNPNGSIWIENSGQTVFTGDILPYDKADFIMRQLAGIYGKVITFESPSLPIILPRNIFNGGRFQGVYPPVTASPSFAIRVPAIEAFTLEDFVESGTLTINQSIFLKNTVMDCKNIIVAGGTSSGKTTLTTALINLIEDDRIVLIEDDPEILCKAKNIFPMRTSEHTSIRDCVFYSLRLNPTRIIVGEIRDGKTACELIEIWGSGHRGGIATVHSDSAKFVRTRLMSLMGQEQTNVNEFSVDNAIDVTVYIESAGNKKIVREIYDSNNDRYIS